VERERRGRVAIVVAGFLPERPSAPNPNAGALCRDRASSALSSPRRCRRSRPATEQESGEVWGWPAPLSIRAGRYMFVSRIAREYRPAILLLQEKSRIMSNLWFKPISALPRTLLAAPKMRIADYHNIAILSMTGEGLRLHISKNVAKIFYCKSCGDLGWS
jgi:hypothetical protein